MRSSAKKTNEALLYGAMDGSMRRVKAALAAGATVDGSPELACTPLVAATSMNEIQMVDFLIEQGADPDRAAIRDLKCPGEMYIVPGDRPLHLAAVRGLVEIVFLLLERGCADPNSRDKKDCTPLLMACACQRNRVNVTRLLLGAGADPALAECEGHNALHILAKFGHVDLLDLMYPHAPAALNSSASNGKMPLYDACDQGHERMVSRLLSLGAVQRTPPDGPQLYPLAVAAKEGHVGVLRVLIKEGMRAVGGAEAVPGALYMGIRYGQAKAVQLLLAVDGEEKRSMWANGFLEGRFLLHYATRYFWPAAISVLLEAGANEAARDWQGGVPLDEIGMDLGQEQLPMDRGKEIAIRRMLAQGPAYRARSWAWSTGEADGVGCGVGGGVVLSSTPVPKGPPLSVRVFRPKSDRSMFARVVGRYCDKKY